VGVTKSTVKSPSNVFLKGQVRTVNPETKKKEMSLLNIELNDFYTNLDLKGGDIIMGINDKSYSLDNIYDMIGESQSWKENDRITIKIKRNGAEQILQGKLNFLMKRKKH
jgi:PDZ domain-containing secreted protein